MNIKGLIKEIISTLLMVAVIFVVIKGFYGFVMEPFIVDGRSMEATLHDGERMFMLKLTDIERFDIVIFPSPNGESNEKGDPSLYVKRVIGVPGDSISYKDDQLILNGEAIEEPYLQELQSTSMNNFTYDFELEDVAGQAVVPEGYFFVLGDNRRNSLDGRSFGFIEIEEVIGEANYVYWPLNNIRTIQQYQLNETEDAMSTD